MPGSNRIHSSGNEPLPRTVDAELVAALNRFEVVAVTGTEGPALASALWTAIGHVQEQTHRDPARHPSHDSGRARRGAAPPGR